MTKDCGKVYSEKTADYRSNTYLIFILDMKSNQECKEIPEECLQNFLQGKEMF